MELTTKKKSVYNIIFGILGQIVTISLGLVLPRMFLINYGSEINGLLNSVNQIYKYLALLEAGVGTATLQALYKPIAISDRDGISGILSATNTFYKRTGLIYLLGVISLSTLYPLFISSDISYFTIFIILLIHGIPGVVNYFFQGKFRIFLQAEGKHYILTNLSTITYVLTSISKIVLIYFGADIIIIQLGYLVFNLLQMLYIIFYVKRHYKWISIKANPDNKAISQKNSVLVHQVCDLIFRNTDMLILSVFCGLKVVSIYSVYTMLFSMISTLLDYLSHGFSFALGQLFNVNRKRYIELRDTYETYRIALVFALYTIADIFIIPFLKLYTDNINDINYIDLWLPKAFIITYLLSCSRANCAADINFAQHFKLTQTRSITEAAINIIVSLIFVNICGIYGVLIGTIAALLYRTNDMIVYSNRKILNRSPWVSYKKFIINFVIYISVSFIGSLFELNLNSYLSIVINAVWIGLIILAVYVTIASIIDFRSFKIAKSYLMGFIRKHR